MLNLYKCNRSLLEIKKSSYKMAHCILKFPTDEYTYTLSPYHTKWPWNMKHDPMDAM